MNAKIIALALVAVVIVGGAGAYLVLNNGNDKSGPDTEDRDPDTGTRYYASVDCSVLGGEVASVKCPEGMTAVASGSGSGSKIEISGIPEGDSVISVTFSDGTVLEYTIKAQEGAVSITGKALDGSSIDKELDTRMTYVFSDGSGWSYWTGNTVSPGVTDSVTPISKSGMKELWKVQSEVDGGSTTWRTPGSPVCVGERTYFYDGQQGLLRCVITSTGKEVASVRCSSDAVYNMALAYGDGKIFVPTLYGGYTILRAYDADTLEQLFVSEPVSGGEVQGAIVYHDGKVLFGTYYGEFACFDTEDTDTSRSDEAVSARWKVDGEGWYNMAPAFFGSSCVIVEKGYDTGGATAYSVDLDTGAILDSMQFDREYCTSGPGSYEGRVYFALNRVTDRDVIDPDASNGKTLTIRSFEVGTDGMFDRASEKVWMSGVKDGGTQSIPIVWNGRLYIGGGGSTMGSNEPFTVLDIASDGTMSLAYTVSSLQTKGTASITTAYSTADDGTVYIYLIEYGHVLAGESMDSTKGYADIFCLRDSPGQTRADIVFTLRPSVEQFAYQSFTISPDGYLLIRNDSTLFCYGDVSRSYGAADLNKAVDRIIEASSEGNVNPADVLRAEYRYSALSEKDKASITGYETLQSLYRTVTFKAGSYEVDVRLLVGSTVLVPPVDIPDGKSLDGWTCNGKAWDLSADRVEGDMVLEAVLVSQLTVSFDSNGGSAVESMKVARSGIMGYVKTPVRDGYTFAGWFSGSAEYVPQHSIVNSDLSLKAAWLKDSRITFDADGGTIKWESSEQYVEVTETKEIPDLPTPRKSGYTFAGWFCDGKEYKAGDIYTLDHGIVLKASWTENDKRTVGDGVKVTGIIPEDAEVTFAKMPTGVASKELTLLREAAGSGSEVFTLGLYGDGIDGNQTFRVDLPVGTKLNGKTVAIYYCVKEGSDLKTMSLSGTVSNGILSLDIQGNSSSTGMQLTFSIAGGTDLSKYTGA